MNHRMMNGHFFLNFYYFEEIFYQYLLINYQLGYINLISSLLKFHFMFSLQEVVVYVIKTHLLSYIQILEKKIKKKVLKNFKNTILQCPIIYYSKVIFQKWACFQGVGLVFIREYSSFNYLKYLEQFY